jgi:hypothetical protein
LTHLLGILLILYLKRVAIHCGQVHHNRSQNFKKGYKHIKTQKLSVKHSMASQGLKRKAEELSALVDRIYGDIGTATPSHKRFHADLTLTTKT